MSINFGERTQLKRSFSLVDKGTSDNDSDNGGGKMGKLKDGQDGLDHPFDLYCVV